MKFEVNLLNRNGAIGILLYFLILQVIIGFDFLLSRVPKRHHSQKNPYIKSNAKTKITHERHNHKHAKTSIK